jgi:flagellar basal body-associated protein FliL
MPNAPGPEFDPQESRGEPGDERAVEPAEEVPMVPRDAETETVVINKTDPGNDPEPAGGQQRERRFTAPGFDAKETAIIATPQEPATEVFASPPGADGATQQFGVPPKAAVPQSIPPRLGAKLRTSRQVNWGWVLAIVVIVLALAAIAILGTVLLTRSKHPKASEEDQVRHTISQYDVAVQRGDLTALRTITCGTARDGYVDYDEHAWQETYQRVSAAKQYPVIASIDQVVVNGQHAEANITTFMAYDPSLRSTRSLDLQYRDDQWKICQSPSG